MASRIELQVKLESVLGTRNVYFQPPESVKMNYPAIRYEMSGGLEEYADDMVYHKRKRYTITVMDRNPDSLIPDKLQDAFKYCSFDRCYTFENLYHYTFTLYY